MSSNILQWFIKYRVFYIIGWLLISFLLLFISFDRQTSLFSQWVGYAVITALAYPVCRYTVNTLIPNYLYRRKVGRFIGYLLLMVTLNGVFTYFFAGYIYHLLTGKPVIKTIIYFVEIFSGIWFINIVLVSANSFFRIIADRYFMEQQLLEIEKEKVSTELNFLRSQINPHFLFNIMNTIYFQIEKTNVEARFSVEKFSEMLRYQLYECTTDKIQISKELNYVKNYIAMQTLRMEKDSDIQLTIQEPAEEFWIAPFLILPIIENAFKHVSSFKDAGRNRIHISLKAVDNVFVIDVANSYENARGEKHLLQSGGLGIQNLKRRLELLYPNRHELLITNDGNTYKTTLNLVYGN